MTIDPNTATLEGLAAQLDELIRLRAESARSTGLGEWLSEGAILDANRSVIWDGRVIVAQNLTRETARYVVAVHEALPRLAMSAMELAGNVPPLPEAADDDQINRVSWALGVAEAARTHLSASLAEGQLVFSAEHLSDEAVKRLEEFVARGWRQPKEFTIERSQSMQMLPVVKTWLEALVCLADECRLHEAAKLERAEALQAESAVLRAELEALRAENKRCQEALAHNPRVQQEEMDRLRAELTTMRERAGLVRKQP